MATVNKKTSEESDGGAVTDATLFRGVESGASLKFTGTQIKTYANSSTRSVATGGTGSTTASAARTALGLAIGTDVQAYSANLAALAGETLDTDGTLAANSDTRLATQKAVKTYVDAAGGTVGKHAVPVSAGAMRPSVAGGCAALVAIASASNQPDIVTLDFDSTTEEYAQFSVAMPKSWNEGTVTFKPIWSHAATTTNFGVVWSLQGVAISNDDGIAAAFGTAQTSTDTGGTTNDLYVGPESSAITIAGTPAAEDVVFFRIARVTADGGDTMAIDARLHGIVLYITTDAGNDA